MWVAAFGVAQAMANVVYAATADAPNSVVRIAGLDVALWLPTGAPGPRPLVLFSHGFGGCKTQSTYLMRALAKHGILVAAPDHRDKGARCPDEPPNLLTLPPIFLEPQGWSENTSQDRRDDLQKLRDALPADPALSGWSIDRDRVALVGHSLGGYTVLGLAGAWPGWRMDKVAAVVALAPYAEPFLTQGALASVAGPVLLQGGEKDPAITPSLIGKVFAATATPACKVIYAEARHLAWTDFQDDFQDVTAAATVAFLSEAFAGRRPDETILASPKTNDKKCK
jgi:predicted dienelactone hydrolase